MPAVPRVTVAIPLFQSAPFVDAIAQNIDRLSYPNLEILISDRHCLDDAADRLAARYRDDPRVRVVRQRDEADWVAHYNDLMRTARGTYFCWMPHDDRYEPGYIEALAAALDRSADAILAFGVMDAEDCGRPVIVPPFSPPPSRPEEPPSPSLAVRLHCLWDLGYAMRGLFRRERALERSLLLPRPRGLVFADVCWVFAMSLHGRLVFVPDARCRKRHYASGASAEWRFGVRQALSEWRTMAVAVTGSPARWPERAAAIGALTYVMAMRVCWRATRGLLGRARRRAPARVRSSVLAPLQHLWGSTGKRSRT